MQVYPYPSSSSRKLQVTTYQGPPSPLFSTQLSSVLSVLTLTPYTYTLHLGVVCTE
jgi:hypothetical protein